MFNEGIAKTMHKNDRIGKTNFFTVQDNKLYDVVSFSVILTESKTL